MAQARTWRIDNSPGGDWGPVKVAELEPVLDPLEAAYRKLPPVRSFRDRERAAIAGFLREHGRLTEEAS